MFSLLQLNTVILIWFWPFRIFKLAKLFISLFKYNYFGYLSTTLYFEFWNFTNHHLWSIHFLFTTEIISLKLKYYFYFRCIFYPEQNKMWFSNIDHCYQPSNTSDFYFCFEGYPTSLYLQPLTLNFRRFMRWCSIVS